MQLLTLALSISLLGLSCAVILTPRDISNVVPGKYVVKLRTGVAAANFVKATSLRRNDGVLSALSDQVGHIFTTVYSGFGVSLDDNQLRALDASPEVEYIEPEQIFKTQGQVQPNADWGLARTSTRNQLSGSEYNYYYRSSSGRGVTVYVIDTGINVNHEEFEGRAAHAYNAVILEGNGDGHGHGTHVAGTVAGKTYGVAKQAQVRDVKVLAGSLGGIGMTSWITSGIDYVARNAPAKSVINMSLGGSASTAIDDAVAAAIARGITTVVAAGNSEANACTASPARVPAAITVAASDVNDGSAYFTNFGSCVDTYAPGVAIRSAWIGSTTATNTISGTSMASPHVAGLAALLIAEHNLETPAAVEARMQDKITVGALTGVPAGTANKLIFNGGNGMNAEDQ